MANNITLKARNKLKGATKKLGLNKHCPPGQILRAPYKRQYTNTVKRNGFNVHRGDKVVRIYPSATSVLVPASCIEDKGQSGKGPKLFGPLKKGELTRYGYSARISREERHKALKKAVLVYGPLTVYHKLDAVAKLTIHTAPEAHKVFKADIEWIRKNFTLSK